MSEEDDIMEKIGYAVDTAAWISEGCSKFKMKVPKRGGVNIVYKDAGRIGRDGRPRGQSIVRVNHPSVGAGHNHNLHINTRPQALAIRGAEAHYRVPTHVVGVSGKAAEVLKGANKVVGPVSKAMDAYNVGTSMINDYRNSTSRNTVQSFAEVLGGCGGGVAGAAGGAAIGTQVSPGLGTLVGGIVGGVAGGFGGSIGAGKMVENIGDACDYNMEERVCRRCKKRFTIRKYRGENAELCPECRSR